MSTTILTSLSTYMSKTSSMTTSKLKFVILKRLNKWKIKKKFRGGSCPGGKCTKVGGGRCHKNRGGRCHKNGGGKCLGGKCNTTGKKRPHQSNIFWSVRRCAHNFIKLNPTSDICFESLTIAPLHNVQSGLNPSIFCVFCKVHSSLREAPTYQYFSF